MRAIAFIAQISAILVKNLETLVAVSPSPNVDHSGLSASKHAWLNIGEGEGTFQLGKQCQVEILGFFQKIREKRCLFQRFVTSIEDAPNAIPLGFSL